jgi:hypothetical protein
VCLNKKYAKHIIFSSPKGCNPIVGSGTGDQRAAIKGTAIHRLRKSKTTEPFEAHAERDNLITLYDR